MTLASRKLLGGLLLMNPLLGIKILLGKVQDAKIMGCFLWIGEETNTVYEVSNRGECKPRIQVALL